MRRLGCLTPLGIYAGLLTLLIVGGVALASGGAMFSPGELNAHSGESLGGVTSHAQLGSRCVACHVDPWSSEVMATRCLNCHSDVRAQLNDVNSLHSAMPDVKQCRSCHSEHNGATASLTHLNVANFPHDRLPFTLAAHQTTKGNLPFVCADCHGDNLTTFDQAKCVTCHRGYQDQFVTQHLADFGENCLACHDGADRYSGFDHNQLKFTLAGKHSEVTCGECHANVRAGADFKSASPACIDCHRKDDAQAHKGEFGTDCALCHTSDNWDRAKFDHNQATFKLEGKHVTVECTECHINSVFKGTPQTCVSCHAKKDKHTGAFGTDCAQCHTASDWKDAKFDHNQAAFKLEGKHVAVECAKCHINNVFKGTPLACVSCHQADDARAHQGVYGTDCAQCHNAGDWKDAKFDHNLAAFKLTGAHVTVVCAKCHINGVYKGTPQTCVGCHAEPQEHLGQFGLDCAQCHSTSTWDDATFDHAFPLDHGESGKVACKTCHVTTDYKQYTCYGCHEHTEQRIQSKHLEEGIRDFQNCMECHPTGREKEGKGGDD